MKDRDVILNIKYQIIQEIGKGSIGKELKVKEISTKRLYAAKI